MIIILTQYVEKMIENYLENIGFQHDCAIENSNCLLKKSRVKLINMYQNQHKMP